MLRESVQVGIGAGPGQDRRVSSGDSPTAFALECVGYDGGPAPGPPVRHYPVDEIDEVVRQSYRDLPAHTTLW